MGSSPGRSQEGIDGEHIMVLGNSLNNMRNFMVEFCYFKNGKLWNGKILNH